LKPIAASFALVEFVGVIARCTLDRRAVHNSCSRLRVISGTLRSSLR
jgi:hypothetical protein